MDNLFSLIFIFFLAFHLRFGCQHVVIQKNVSEKKKKKITQHEHNGRTFVYIFIAFCLCFACIFAHKPYQNRNPMQSVYGLKEEIM